MTDTTIATLLQLRRTPVAVGFMASLPEDIEPWDNGPVAAGCSFWKEAQAGRTFYTVPSDHYNCAIGAFTHNITLPDQRASELGSTVGFMVQSGYIRLEEVPGIPHLAGTPAAIVYGPVDRVHFVPDLVICALRPGEAMLLFEAAARSGEAHSIQTIGRPACAALPLAQLTNLPAGSLGCKGNRTFTGLPDDEMYVVVPGKQWSKLSAALHEIILANRTMEQHYRAHLQSFSVSTATP